jgi:nucleoid DNA-binding protein
VKRKRDLDLEVARLLDMPFNRVSLVTGCFLRTLLHEIVDNREVLVDGFGNFLLKEQKNVAIDHLTQGNFKKGERVGTITTKPRKKFRVWFKKSAKFREALADAYGHDKEHTTMEKYGVDEGAGDQEKLEKQAAAGCPECGAKPSCMGRS